MNLQLSADEVRWLRHVCGHIDSRFDDPEARMIYDKLTRETPSASFRIEDGDLVADGVDEVIAHVLLPDYGPLIADSMNAFVEAVARLEAPDA